MYRAEAGNGGSCRGALLQVSARRWAAPPRLAATASLLVGTRWPLPVCRLCDRADGYAQNQAGCTTATEFRHRGENKGLLFSSGNFSPAQVKPKPATVTHQDCLRACRGLPLGQGLLPPAPGAPAQAPSPDRPFLGGRHRSGPGRQGAGMLLVLSEEQKAHLGFLPRVGGAGLASVLRRAPAALRLARRGPRGAEGAQPGWREGAAVSGGRSGPKRSPLLSFQPSASWAGWRWSCCGGARRRGPARRPPVRAAAGRLPRAGTGQSRARGETGTRERGWAQRRP